MLDCQQRPADPTDGNSDMNTNQAQFETYKDFLRAHIGVFPEYRDLYFYLEDHRNNWDVLDHNGTRLVISDLVGQSFKTRTYDPGDGTPEVTLKRELKTHDENVKLRVLHVVSFERMPFQLVEALGMTFDLEPSFLRGLIGPRASSEEDTEHPAIYRKSRLPPGIPMKSEDYLIMEPYFLSLVFNNRGGINHSIPIVLIFVSNELRSRPSHGIETYGRPSIFRTAHQNSKFSSALYNALTPSNFAKICAQTLQSLPRKDLHTLEHQALECLRPVISISLELISDRIEVLRFLHQDRSSGEESQTSAMLQHHAEAVHILENLRLFIRDFENGHSDREQTADMSDIINCCKRTLDDGYHISSIVQERIQIENGILAIRESQKSIEEAQSVKRLTQLAFVYIPLTYSATLFGMNVKQMNESGPTFWIFALTSICFVLVTLAVWSSTKIIKGFRL